MANNSVTYVLRGKLNYPKIVGDPVLNYNKDGKEWKTDFYDFPVKEVKAMGISDRVKSKENYLDGQSFLTFKVSEFKKDGSANKPPKIVDSNNQPWPDDVKIGNGSDVDVKFSVVDYGVGKKKGVYLRSVRVLRHVPYNDAESFEPLSKDDEFYVENTNDFSDTELDDDISDVI